MRMMIPVVRCDHCHGDISPEVRSAIVEATLPGQKSVRYSGENCDACRDKFSQELLDLLDGYLNNEKAPATRKRTIPAAASAPAQPRRAKRSHQPMAEFDKDGWSVEDRTCPIRGCGKVSVSRGGLGQHLNKDHGTTFAEQGMRETTEQRAVRLARVGRA